MTGLRVAIVLGPGVAVDPGWVEALVGRLRVGGDVRIGDVPVVTWNRDGAGLRSMREIRDADWVVVLCGSDEDCSRILAGLDRAKTIPVVVGGERQAARPRVRGGSSDREERERRLDQVHALQVHALLRRRILERSSFGRGEPALEPETASSPPPPKSSLGPPPAKLGGRRRAPDGAKALAESIGGAFESASEREPPRAREPRPPLPPVDDAAVAHGDVQVTTVAPRAVEPGSRFLVEVVFHVEGFEVEAGEDRAVREGAAALSLREGAHLTVRLVSVDEGVFAIDDPEARLVWGPPSRRVEFRLRAARELPDGTYDLRLEYWLEGVQLARHYLEIVVGPGSTARPEPPSVSRRRLPRSAFASYSRRDKATVAQRVDSLKAVGIDVFLDSLDIRQGADWRDVLERELLGREALLLFWSTAAKKSEWVEKEWRFALERRGLATILPNALEPPATCPPPPELASLQFGSVLTELARHWAATEPPR